MNDPAVEVAKIVIFAIILYKGLQRYTGVGQRSVAAMAFCFLSAGGCAAITNPNDAGVGAGMFLVCLVAANLRLRKAGQEPFLESTAAQEEVDS